MSFNGSGTFQINTAGQPVVSGTVISSTAFNALTADLATGLSTCITKDGQTTVTANIPMGNNKITGLANATLATDAANLGQVQGTTVKLISPVSGADTITGSMTPALTAYAGGQMFYFIAVGDNTGPVTLNIDSLGAKAVTRDGSVALAASDIKSGEVVVVVYDGVRFQVVSQLNSSGDARFANVSIASALNVGGVATVTGGSVLNGGVVINEPGANADTRIEGDTDQNLVFVDASADAVGIGTSSPAYKLDVRGTFGSGNGTITTGFSWDTRGLVGTFSNHGLGFFTNGTVVGVWDTSGNLGIGTTSPTAKLDVSSSGTTTLRVNRLGVADVYLTAGANGIYGLDTASTNLGFGVSNSLKMTLDSSGNLGIGITSPAAGLHVANGNVRLTNGSAFTSSNSLIREINAAAGSSNQFVTSSIGFRTDAFVDSGIITFGTASGASTPTERARLTSAGNFKINGTADRGTTEGTGQVVVFNGTAPVGTLTNGVSFYAQNGLPRMMDATGEAFTVGYRNIPASGTKTGSYTLQTTDVGKYVQIGTGGSITIPNATFAEGDIVSLFNNTTGNITITCTITTAYIGGIDSDKATVTLATRGVATIFFISGTVCVINGNVS